MGKYDNVIKHNWNQAIYTVPDKLDRETTLGAVAGMGFVVIGILVFSAIAVMFQ